MRTEKDEDGSEQLSALLKRRDDEMFVIKKRMMYLRLQLNEEVKMVRDLTDKIKDLQGRLSSFTNIRD